MDAAALAKLDLGHAIRDAKNRPRVLMDCPDHISADCSGRRYVEHRNKHQRTYYARCWPCNKIYQTRINTSFYKR